MDPETAEQVRSLMAKGFAGTIFLTTEGCQAAYEELKGRSTMTSKPCATWRVDTRAHRWEHHRRAEGRRTGPR